MQGGAPQLDHVEGEYSSLILLQNK